MRFEPDSPEDKVNKTLLRLSEERGYSELKLFDCKMLDLFPKDWARPVKAASCNKLIRDHIVRVSNPKYASAVEAAFGLADDYKSAHKQDRLVLFAQAWSRKHPNDEDSSEVVDYESAREAGRKWWYAGKKEIVRQICYEIARRDRTGDWAQPSQAVLDHFERVVHALAAEKQDADVSALEDMPESFTQGFSPGIVSPSEISSNDGEPPSPPNADHPRSRQPRLRTRAIIEILLWLILGMVWLFLGGSHQIGLLYYETTQAATCSDIGNSRRGTPDTTWSGPFRAAYQDAGGRSAVGCPRTNDPSGYVHQWGAGVSQDLQGGEAGIARIMALDPQHVIVMAGAYWHDYTDAAGGKGDPNAAQEKGYPTNDPVICGRGRLVMLEQSQQGMSPGAMVTNPQGTHFVWLPKAVWTRYATTGGPLGQLGLPVGPLTYTWAGSVQHFEHGAITVGRRGAHTDLELSGRKEPANPKAVAAFHSCIQRASTG